MARFPELETVSFAFAILLPFTLSLRFSNLRGRSNSWTLSTRLLLLPFLAFRHRSRSRSLFNVKWASTSASIPKGKKEKKKKPSDKGPKVGPTPKIGKSKGKKMARAKETVSNAGYLATGRGTS